MPSIRLVTIDDDLRQAVESARDDFSVIYGASLGRSRALVQEVVSQTLALLLKTPRAPEWGGFLVVAEAGAEFIGTCAFKHGPEVDGTVEIAYFTFPGFEGRGFATAMAREMMRRALLARTVRQVVAHTLPQRSASTRVLEKVGMRLVGEVCDPEDGMVWLWAHRPTGGKK